MSPQKSTVPRTTPRRNLTPHFVLVVGFFITALFAGYVWKTAQARDLARFNTTSQDLTLYTRGRPRFYIEVLRAGAGLFALSPSITPGQFKNFIDRLELKEQYQGPQGIGFLARVKSEEAAAFSASMHARGRKDFQIQPATEHNEFYPVTYFERLDESSEAVFGWDMFSEPIRRQALETARDSGLPAITGRVMVKRGKDSAD